MGKTGESSARRRATGTSGRKTTAPRATRRERETTAPKKRASASGNGAAPRDTTESPAERAEVMLDDIGQWVGAFAIVAAERLRRVAARAREEVEDMVAEAEAIRRGK